MNYDNPLLSFFPVTQTIKEPRSNQIEVLEKLWIALQQNKKIIACLPTGAGKSAVAMTLLNNNSSLDMHGIYTSPLNLLVEQVHKEFSQVRTLRGRKWYPCMSGRKNAEEGFCQTDDCPHKKESRMCRAWDETCQKCACQDCLYKKIKQDFVKSKIANTNFSLFLLKIHNSPDLIVIDEADCIEDFVRMQFTVTVQFHTRGTFDDHIIALSEYARSLDEITKDLTDKDKIKDKINVMRTVKSIDFLVNDYCINKEPWVVTQYWKGKEPRTKYEPILIERFISPLLEGKMVLMMSATPPRYEGYAYIEAGSTFPVEIRPWEFKPIGRMSLKHRDKTIPKVADFLSTLKGKTLVHCISYDTAAKLNLALRRIEIFPLLQINSNFESDLENSGTETVQRWDAVQGFKKADDPNKILLSVKLDRGVDFAEPDIINNVIAVMPWANPSDPLTKAKNEYIGTDWQNKKIADDIQQMYGRVNRNAIKTTHTYITDSNFNNASLDWWFKNNKTEFFEWFLSAEIKN